jgi:hypothetical protein
MVQKALEDEAISLFSQESPRYLKDEKKRAKECWHFLFTKLVEFPGQVSPVHLGIYLKGVRRFDEKIYPDKLLRGWKIVINDESLPSENMRLATRTFPLGYAIKDNIVIYTDFSFDSYLFWDDIFQNPDNALAFTRMVSAHPPSPPERVVSQKSYGGRGVGFNHMVPDMKRAWRIWHEWFVSASVLSLW